MRAAFGAEVPLQSLVHLQPKVDLGVKRVPRLGAALVVPPDVIAYDYMLASDLDQDSIHLHHENPHENPREKHHEQKLQ